MTAAPSQSGCGGDNGQRSHLRTGNYARRNEMGIAEKFDAAKDKVTGKVKETIGKVAHDHSQVVAGKMDQAKGEAKDTIADDEAHLKGGCGRPAHRRL